jgi:hypothetical protein
MTWKAVERRIAKQLGGQRNPLSGIRSGHGTHGDLLHPTLYGEFKHTKRAAILSLLRATVKLAKRERKIPLVIMHEKGTQNYAAVLPFSDFLTIWNALREAGEVLRGGTPGPNQLGKRIRQITGGK